MKIIDDLYFSVFLQFLFQFRLLSPVYPLLQYKKFPNKAIMSDNIKIQFVYIRKRRLVLKNGVGLKRGIAECFANVLKGEKRNIVAELHAYCAKCGMKRNGRG